MHCTSFLCPMLKNAYRHNMRQEFSKICHSPAAYVSVLSIVHKDTVILHFFYMGKIYKHTSVCDIKVRLRELILPKSKWLDTVIDTIQSVYNRVSFF